MLVKDTPHEDNEVPVPAHHRSKRVRKLLDPALPREVIRHELPESEHVCPRDGTLLTEIGVEASEQLDIVSAKVRVIRHERIKYACPCCGQAVRTAPAPVKLLPKSLLTENALAWVITSKYQDGLPLYRPAALFGPLGGELSRHTLAHHVVHAGAAVQPVINLLRDHLLDAGLIFGDETEVQVPKAAGRHARNKSYLWAQMSGTDPPIRLFTYAPSRSAKTALMLYNGAKGGALITDGYEPYAAVAHAYGLVHLGCWDHARRAFVEAERAMPKANRSPEHLATQCIALIGELYAVEARWRDTEAAAQTAAERLRLRQCDSKPILARIEALLQANLPDVLPRSLLGRALHYLAGQWPKLVRFVDDGLYPIDNIPCENALRPFVIGRRNWLFCGTVAGAHASANLYSLIETAKANRIEPYHYLRALFAQLPHARTVDDVEVLLPWNLKLGN
jgi:transposase